MAEVSAELIKSFKTAIGIENKGLITYLKFARQTKDETGKNMFIQLAIDEYEHRRILEEHLNKVMAGEIWHEVEIPKSVIEQIAPTVSRKQERTKGQSGLEDVDALKTALEMERKAAQMFRAEATQTTVTEAKALLNRLADWEDTHYDLIQAELDTINRTGFWMGVPEFRMDGKF